MAELDYYEDLCPFCENNLMLIYICDDCGSVFCGDCLKESTSSELVCQVCGKPNIEKDKSDNFHCTDCKSTSIVSVQKNHSICPSCTGTNVVKISDKTKFLKEEFKSIVTGTRDWLRPLIEKSETLINNTYRLIELRENTIKLYHFQNLEVEILQLFKLFNNLRESVEKKTVDFFNEINRNLKYFFKIDHISPKTIPIVEGIAQNLQNNSNENLEYVNQSVDRFENRLASIILKINFIHAIHLTFKNYMNLVYLAEDEKPVFGIRCKLDMGENDNSEYGSKSGTILLTNKRLYFLHEKGIRKKKKRTVLLFSVQLDDLQRVNVEGKISKKLNLEFATGMYKFKLNKEKRDQLIDEIEKARLFDNIKIDPENIDALKQVKIDFNPLRDSLEDAIYAIVNFDRNRTGINQDMQYSQQNNSINPLQEIILETETQISGGFKKYPHLNKWLGNPNQEQTNYINNHRANNIQDPRKNRQQPLPHKYPQNARKAQVDYLYQTYRKRPFIQQNPHYNRDPYQYDSRNDPNNYPEYRRPEYPPYEYENVPHNPHPYPDQDPRTYYDRNYPPVRSNHLDPRINPNYRNVPPASDINSQPRRYGPVYPEKRADLDPYRQDPYPIGSQVFDQPIRMDYGNRNNPPDDEYQPDEIDNSYNPSENLYQKFDQIRKPVQTKVNPRVDEFLKAMEEFDAEYINSNSMENSMQKRNLSREIRGKTQKTSNKNTYGSRTVRNPHAKNGLMSMFDGPNLTKPKIPKPISRIPKMNFSKLSKPRNFVEELQKLEERQFGVKRTIEKLEIAQSRGRISESAYLEKYQNLQQLLYKTQKQIEDISKFI